MIRRIMKRALRSCGQAVFHTTVSLTELGIEPSDEVLRAMAHSCAVASGGKKGSAKVLYEEDMYQIYKAAK